MEKFYVLIGGDLNELYTVREICVLQCVFCIELVYRECLRF